MMYERHQQTRLLDGRRNHHHNNHLINPTFDNHSTLKSINDLQKSSSSLRSSSQNDYHHHHCCKNKEERLEIVDLSGLSLDSLPTPSINLAAICKLDLSNNNLQNIPESLTARLLNAVVLDVHSNQLTCLPNSIGCLSKLKILNVAGNLLSSLPRTIEDCKSLEELNANFNKLTSLPDTLGFELLSLKKLSVNSNKLMFLPYSLSHATDLRILDVRLNDLRSLPDDLENLTNLQILNVSQNFQYLTELPYSIGLLISLTELDVSYNKITELPTSIGCLRKLQKLKVEGNPLVFPPLEVMEQGVHAVKQFMSEKMNENFKEDSSKHHKKRSWLKQIKRYGTFNGLGGGNGNRNGNVTPGRRSSYEVERSLVLPEYRPIDALASPRYKLGIFSPKRFLSSPKNYFSRLK